MSKLFYFSEIVKFAIEKEIESYELYRKLAELTADAATKKVFQTLMQDEKQHETFYESMLNSIAQQQSTGVTEDDEYVAYMQALIAAGRETPVITDSQLNNVAYALEYAVSREKDSIVFYIGLRKFLPAGENDRIDAIIEEEAKHIARLLRLKSQLA